MLLSLNGVDSSAAPRMTISGLWMTFWGSGWQQAEVVGTASPCWKRRGPGICVAPLPWIPDQVRNDGGGVCWITRASGVVVMRAGGSSLRSRMTGGRGRTGIYVTPVRAWPRPPIGELRGYMWTNFPPAKLRQTPVGEVRIKNIQHT